MVVRGVLVLGLAARQIPPRALLVRVVPIVVVVIVVVVVVISVLLLLVLLLLILVLDVVSSSIVIGVLVGRPLRHGDDDRKDASDEICKDDRGGQV